MGCDNMPISGIDCYATQTSLWILVSVYAHTRHVHAVVLNRHLECLSFWFTKSQIILWDTTDWRWEFRSHAVKREIPIGTTEAFNEINDDCNAYVEQVEQYFIANKIKEEKQLCSA